MDTTTKIVTISSPNYEACLNMKVVEKFEDCTTLVLTVIASRDDLILDHCFENITISRQTSTEMQLATKSEKKAIGIFMLVSFMFADECDSLFDIFNKYDGKVLAYTHEALLKMPREEFAAQDLKSLPNIYILTGYNDKDFNSSEKLESIKDSN